MENRKRQVTNGGWADETVPSRRARPDREGREPGARSGRATTSAFVWVLGFMVVVLVLAVCGLWALVLLRGQAARSGPTPTPIIWTPTPAPTPTASPPSPPTETPGPTPTISPEIAIGGYVRVTGTGGYGLNLRSGPGEDYVRMDVALEGEVFIVVDGPTVAGDAAWWKVQDPDDAAREWWVVGNFLEPIENP